MANRLAKETSPYLLQHQDNPVDWYPWSEEALARALKEDKPILLSIGYSACHWCHVMEHESFENPEVARLMNENFINIKVDREERPDLDQIYQNVAQVMTRGGGWPLTVFLTPAMKPFYGGTYFPPDDRYGRPGFSRVLIALSQAYLKDRAKVEENAEKLTEVMSSLKSDSLKEGKRPELADFQSIAEQLIEKVDWKNGGLGSAPKFPNPMIFSFLWRVGKRLNLEKACEATRLTLTRLALSGTYDQLGGGFHRYSVDEFWSVPHFEKMLYDNALLLKLYAEVLLSSREDLPEEERNLYLNVLIQSLDYIFREMMSPEGVFYSAQDADSEGEEGKYFVWDLKDLRAELSEIEAKVFALRYGITQDGNFEHEKTVLFIAAEISKIAQVMSLSEAEVFQLLESSKLKLFDARRKRVAPSLDNKVLTSWNALMISGLVWAAQALSEMGESQRAQQAHAAAERTFRFLTENLKNEENRLRSTFQSRKNEKGVGKGNAYLDDYAFMARAALDLSRTTRDANASEKYLQQGASWISVILKHFKDSGGPGYFFTSDDHEKLLQRPKTLFDQAIPSGTAVALSCMAAFAELDFQGQTNSYMDEIERQWSALFQQAIENPYGMGELLCFSLMHVQGVVTVSGREAPGLCVHPGVFRKPDVGAELRVCHQRACSLSLRSPEEARQMILQKLGLA